MEEQKELRQQFRQQQEKYIYYLIALSVTAIGFAVHKTSGVSMKWIQLPLGLSVLAWGLSIFTGLKFLGYSISALYTNNAYFEVIKGNDPMVGNHLQKKKIATDTLLEVMKKNSDTASKYAEWQNRLFYSGVVLFLVWHILEMATV